MGLKLSLKQWEKRVTLVKGRKKEKREDIVEKRKVERQSQGRNCTGKKVEMNRMWPRMDHLPNWRKSYLDELWYKKENK